MNFSVYVHCVCDLKAAQIPTMPLISNLLFIKKGKSFIGATFSSGHKASDISFLFQTITKYLDNCNVICVSSKNKTIKKQIILVR